MRYFDLSEDSRSNARQLLNWYTRPLVEPDLHQPLSWTKRIFLLFVLSIMLVQQSAWAAAAPTCTNVVGTCLDATPCKNINGYTVCLAGVTGGQYNITQSCWNMQYTGSCDMLNVNTCGTTPTTCNQTGQTCAQTDLNTGACVLYDRNYSCDLATNDPPLINSCGGISGSLTSTYCSNQDSYPFVYNGSSYGPLEATAAGYVPSLSTTVPTTQLSPNPNSGQCLEFSNQYANNSINMGAQACTPIPGTNIDNTACSVQSQSCAQYNANGVCTAYNLNESCLVTTDSKVCGTPPAGCSMTTSTCSQINPVTNQCILWAQNYSCAVMTNVPNTVDTCSQEAPSCVKTGSSCTSTDPYPYFYNNPAYGLLEADSSGFVPAMNTTVPIAQLSSNPNYGACYSYTDTYSCSSPSNTLLAGYCTPIPTQNLNNCSVNSSTCTATNAQGVCTNYSQNLSCTVTQQTNICGTPPSNLMLTNSTCAETDPLSSTCVLYNQTWVGPSIFGAPAPVNNCQSMPTGCVKTGQICALSDTYPMAYNSPVYGLLEATSSGTVPALNNVVIPANQLIANPNFGTCITYTDTYSCSTPNTSNQTCTPLLQSSLGNCAINSSTCTATNAQGICTNYSQVQTCLVASSTTGQTPGTVNNTTQNTCSTIPANCTLSSQTCLDNPPNPIASCNTIQNSYTCTNPNPSVTSCQSNLCIGANCYGTGDLPNQDFAAAVSALETAKQMGKFGGVNLFYGESHDCSDTLGGLFSCCQVRSSPPQSGSNLQAAATMAVQMGLQYNNYFGSAASSFTTSENQSVLNVLGGQGDVLTGPALDSSMLYGADANTLTTTFGDSYSFDSLMSSNSFMNMDMADLSNWAGTAASLLAQYGVISPQLATAVSLGASYYSSVIVSGCVPCFVVILIITIYQYLSSCSQEEMQLSLLRGKGLCHDVGTYCSDSILGVCLQTTDSFCCFDSKFALDVNEGGRPQIGKSWGTPQSPNCSGFSITDIGNINFGAINFTNAFGDIAANTNVPNSATLQSEVSNKINTYYGGQTTTATQVQMQSMAQVLKVLPAPNTVLATNVTSLAPMACTATWGPQVPDTFTPPDFTSSINITSCNPGATIQLNYTGNCTSTSLSPGQSSGTLSIPISASGTASIPVSMPYTCVPAPATPTTPAITGSLNTWAGIVIQNGAMGSQISITW